MDAWKCEGVTLFTRFIKAGHEWNTVTKRPFSPVIQSRSIILGNLFPLERTQLCFFYFAISFFALQAVKCSFSTFIVRSDTIRVPNPRLAWKWVPEVTVVMSLSFSWSLCQHLQHGFVQEGCKQWNDMIEDKDKHNGTAAIISVTIPTPLRRR